MYPRSPSKTCDIGIEYRQKNGKYYGGRLVQNIYIYTSCINYMRWLESVRCLCELLSCHQWYAITAQLSKFWGAIVFWPLPGSDSTAASGTFEAILWGLAAATVSLHQLSMIFWGLYFSLVASSSALQRIARTGATN
ncbi:hypothetical protein K438DRAFT_1140921 [Mycena galopus ATCC 62051]|nr:hypothetical protein K438DRAFT_1140921 [Mycena galopus ATCC 62051]